MNKWEDLFEISRVEEEFKSVNGEVHPKVTYYIVNKATGDRVFTKMRKYGYSQESSAKSGAAHMFRQIIKVMEKELLGKN